jgi:hypothetical protein
VLDATVGNAMGDLKLHKRGSALAERSDTLSRAARLDAAATQKEEHADEDLEEAHDAKERDVQEARTDADQRKPAAAEAAQKRTAAAKRQADELAAQRTESVEKAKREEQARIRAE